MTIGQRAWKWWMAASLVGAHAIAPAAEDVPVRTLPSSVMLGAERVHLPAGERMGLVGASYVFELAPGWWLGPSVYGAATGERGGLFTWGAEAQRRWRLGEHWGVVTGLYAGGGGGAAAPVGGGLMLRPHADLMVDFGGWQAGLTASQVRFPSGAIRSSQLGLLVMVEDRFAFAPPGHNGERVAFGSRGGIGADRMQLVAGRYSGRRDANGGSLGFVGLRLEQQATDNLSATIEAAGAAQGGADGYMEALAGLSWQWPVGGEALRVGVRGAGGLAGGGAVKTGGGLVGKAALTARWQITPTWSLDLEGGRAKALHGDFSANFVQASLGMTLSDRPSLNAGARETLHDMEWSLGLLHYAHAARKDGTSRPMDLVALQFNRAINEHLYLTGQAHSAIAGGAGAYSVGLVGLSGRLPIGQSGWTLGADALVGAAGGGGVASNGGAVAQPMAWVSRDLGTYGRLRLGAGKIRARHGGLSTPVFEATWAFQFGTP